MILSISDGVKWTFCIHPMRILRKEEYDWPPRVSASINPRTMAVLRAMPNSSNEYLSTNHGNKILVNKSQTKEYLSTIRTDGISVNKSHKQNICQQIMKIKYLSTNHKKRSICQQITKRNIWQQIIKKVSLSTNNHRICQQQIIQPISARNRTNGISVTK